MLPDTPPSAAVSTHSRLKAAANELDEKLIPDYCFNTQPPEGGCARSCTENFVRHSFNTQPPEGGCIPAWQICAAFGGFNTQPPEGGCSRPP